MKAVILLQQVKQWLAQIQVHFAVVQAKDGKEFAENQEKVLAATRGLHAIGRLIDWYEDDPTLIDQTLSRKHVMVVEEGERQAILLALAHLSIERPGWEVMLREIAMKMDNEVQGKPQMFEHFRATKIPHEALTVGLKAGPPSNG
jgi:hypothetical protein